MIKEIIKDEFFLKQKSKDATPEVVDMYNTVAARIYDKIAKHLDGSDPFPTDELIYAKKINNFVDELGEACEQILRAVME